MLHVPQQNNPILIANLSVVYNISNMVNFNITSTYPTYFRRVQGRAKVDLPASTQVLHVSVYTKHL